MAKVCPNCELAYTDDDFFCAADGTPLRSTGAEPDNLVGMVIAERYKLEAIIGEGGMGRVYRARHVRVPREAAIKVLRRALIADPYAVAAFNREARNAASVGDHPNVAAVYDFGETADGLVFLAMEFIEGETLGRRLERDPVLPPARAVEIVRQIGAGLTAAHELPEPVVHRDLKPDNILLKATRDGSDWVKIVDFGIAKAAKRETQLLTTPGLVVGTPRYMSPEQLTGGTIDVRSDVYALGMIAYQMLTGRMPFASTSPNDEATIQWALQRLTLKPLTLRQVAPDVQWPAAAQEVFDRALATMAEDRTPSASEFARGLARAFGLTTPSSIIGVVGDAPGPVSNAVRSAAGSLAPTAPLALSGDPPAVVRTTSVPNVAAAAPRGPTGSPATASPSAPEPPTRRSRAAMGLVAGALIITAVGGFFWQRARTPAVSMTPTVSALVPNGSVPVASPSPAASAPARTDASAPRATTPDRATGNTVKPAASPPASSSASNAPKPPAPNPSTVNVAARTRAALDRVKSALAIPDSVTAAGNGEAILEDIRRLLPRLATSADSVEATYYAVEANLNLDRPVEACRLLRRIQPASRGTPFEGKIDRFLGAPELACASRR